jgi:hypothetical protein
MCITGLKLAERGGVGVPACVCVLWTQEPEFVNL